MNKSGLMTRSMAAVAALVAVTISTGVASSAPPPPSAQAGCEVGYACLWPETEWGGKHWQGKGHGNKKLPSAIYDKALSSLNNDLERYACFWRDENFKGERMREAPGSRRANLALDRRPNGGNWAREFSSQSWNC